MFVGYVGVSTGAWGHVLSVTMTTCFRLWTLPGTCGDNGWNKPPRSVSISATGLESIAASLGSWTVDVSASVPHATAVGFNNSHSFQHPDAAVIELRVLVDRMMVEA